MIIYRVFSFFFLSAHGGYTTSPKEEVATTGPKALFGKFKSKPKPEPQETQNIAAPKSHMPQLGEKPELVRTCKDLYFNACELDT